jgi:hypothetical protein
MCQYHLPPFGEIIHFISDIIGARSSPKRQLKFRTFLLKIQPHQAIVTKNGMYNRVISCTKKYLQTRQSIQVSK